MEEKELREFSWTNLFLVTGLCFIVFSKLLKLLDGSNTPMFFRIGLLCTAIGLIAYLNRWLSPKFYSKDKSSLSSSKQQEQLF